MRKNKNRGFTLIEILIVAAIMSVLGLYLSDMYLHGVRTFNKELWKSNSVKEMDRTFLRIEKMFNKASYPTYNKFQGVLKDKDDQWAFTIKGTSLSESEAYSNQTRRLQTENVDDNDTASDAAAAEYYYFGTGTKSGLTNDTIPDNRLSSDANEEILEFTSCVAGFKDMPGLDDAMPRCAKHLLYLANRKNVLGPNSETYLSYQDLILETRYCLVGEVAPAAGNISYGTGEGAYTCSDGSFTDSLSGLTPEESNNVGKKLLASNVATVTVKKFLKSDSDRSSSMELDIIAVAPNVGNAIVKKSIQFNVSTKIIAEGSAGAPPNWVNN
ncbi:MAG: type II secretion system protein [Candidatus Cloacimonetes bacterium]|nr:type II secretion system protein [Candidatus Cloacimonadota bacterium]